MDRHSQPQVIPRGRPVSGVDAAHANEYFEFFLNATSLKQILGYYRCICQLLHLKPNVFPLFYPKLRANLNSWKAKALWKKFDARASHKCYGKSKVSANTRVLIIGAGPCGLRSAIEAQLLGAKVVVIEKRDRLSRNNVLHLWPFVIEDLRILGAKKFFGKFCAGAIDHISIRQLQCILFKVALLLGVEIHTEVSFEKLIEPNAVEKTGWRAEFKPSDHPVSQYEFDVILGADGKRNTLQGFKRKEFRGKLAIAITANFINKRTKAEARVEEISGVAFIFNQKFFKELYEETKIDLENIVYYKDDTHYFVMTAKKPSLIEKGVIKQDLADTERLLASENVDKEALMNYAKEAADFSTNYQMPDLEFAVNHYGLPDVAMFDFTSMYAAENASKCIERNGYRLLMILVGDSLLEPFWPTGSGCARGFLSSMDAAWAIRSWGSGTSTPLEVLAERESIYRLLAQTTPDNLNKDWKSYTLDPSSRYPNLIKNVLLPHQITNLYDTDNPKSIEKMKRNSIEASEFSDVPKKRSRGNVDNEVLINWLRSQLREHEDINVTDIPSIFRDGKVLCAILSRYRPDLLDYNMIKDDEPSKNNQLAVDIFEKELGIPPLMSGEEITFTEDYLTMASYLTQIFDHFRREIAHIKHPKLTEVTIYLENTNFSQIIPNIPKHQSVFTVYNNRDNKKHNNSNKEFLNEITKKLREKLQEKLLLLSFRKAQLQQKKGEQGDNNNNNNNICCYVVNKKNEEDNEIQVKYYDENFKEIGSNIFSNKSLFKLKPTISETRSPKKSLSVYTIKKFDSLSTVKDTKSSFSIRILENKPDKNCLIQKINYDPTGNLLTVLSNTSWKMKSVFPKKSSRFSIDKKSKNIKCQIKLNGVIRYVKFSSLCNMSDDSKDYTDQIYSRVNQWICSHDFTNENEDTKKTELSSKVSDSKIETNIVAGTSDITSITKCLEKLKKGLRSEIKVEERTNEINCIEEEDVKEKTSGESEVNFERLMKNMSGNTVVRTLSKFSQYSPFQQHSNESSKVISTASRSNVPSQFSIIMEGEESELPEVKQSHSSFKSFKQFHPPVQSITSAHLPQAHIQRPSSRHKRHADSVVTKISSDKKSRKHKTLEKVGVCVEERQKILEEIVANRNERQNKRRQHRKLQTEQFVKSMQMLQANAKADKSLPFEDYSIFLYRQTAPNFEDRVKDLEKQFTYIPDHENKLPNQTKGKGDEDLAARIKNLEDKWKDPQPVEKKPKDLMRAIGKIETTDWNIKEIEKKILENKLGKPSNKDKEKVPKWSKEQFIARQTKMEKQHLDRQDSTEAKYADIDKNIKHLELKLKEGTARDLGQNKVASITEKLVSKVPEEPKPVAVKPTPKPPVMLPSQTASEFCHFCKKRVYLMERLSAEGRFFHHGCFKCQYCNTQLRLGSYAFDRDGMYGHKFFCIHHYGMQGEIRPPNKIGRKPSQRLRDIRSPEKRPLSGVAGLDLLDRVQTPERIEFANLSTGQASDHEESLSQMDEDEWTDKNFGASAAELGSSDDESSSLSDTDSDDEDAYEEALEVPITKEGTMKWAELLKNRYARKRLDLDSDEYSSSAHSSYYENSSDDDESDTATEGEEEIRARELRKQEVRVEPPVVQTDTCSDTEVVSDETSTSSSEILNSATEISTDSEFAHDDPTPTREIPAIALNDINVTKTRGSSGLAKKIQVTKGYVHRHTNGKAPKKQDIELKLTPLVPSSPIIRKPAPKLLPRTEGYALNRTQSTGGIAAKVSLELKKKYLLGENVIAGGIQKSGSASTLDSKLKSFHTNISDCQKLLKPAPEVSASMQTFCNKLNERSSPVLSPQSPKTFTNLFENATTEETTKELPPPDVTKVDETNEESTYIFENVNEGRPRSPVHETSIIVPDIDWSKKKEICQSDDSLSESSSTENDVVKTPIFNYSNIPTLTVDQVLDVEDIQLDSLCVETENHASMSSEPPKSITSEKKTLNQPKLLPDLGHDYVLPEIHNSLHMKVKEESKFIDKQSPSEDVRSLKNSSGRSSPSIADSCAEQATTAALTETELSDWARDGEVSDDLEGVEFELNQDSENIRSNKKPKQLPIIKNSNSNVKLANMTEFDDPSMNHVCKNRDNFKNKTIITEAMNSILCSNLDNIEFMDTGTETSSDDGFADSRNGYVLFKDEDELAEDSLNPNINNIVEAKNTHLNDKFEKIKNTGYCIIANEDYNYGSEVIDLKPSDLECFKQKQLNCDHDEDSLLILDPGTTTEENTCSDSTVKNVTEIPTAEKVKNPISKTSVIDNNNFQRQRLEERLAKLKAEQATIKQIKEKDSSVKENISDKNNLEYSEHVQRLQSKVEFGNAKDSIDIRKSRRRSKSEIQKPDLIQEEKEKSSPVHSPKTITLNLTSSISRTPDILYKKEVIEKERDVNQKLIQEMVMNKMKAENKSLERKKRNRNIISPNNKSFELLKSATTDISQLNSSPSTTPTNRLSTYSSSSSNYATPDVLLSINNTPLQKSQTVSAVNTPETYSTPQTSIKNYSSRPLSGYETSKHAFCSKKDEIKKSIFNEDFKTPKPPPRQKHDESKQTAEKLKQNARARARLLSNEELGLSPEDKIAKIKQKLSKIKTEDNVVVVDPHIQESIESLVMNTERRNSFLYSNDTLKKKKNNSFKRSKSGEDTNRASIKKLTCPNSIDNLLDDTPKKDITVNKICKSDPNLLETDYKKTKKKPKDRERKKSITNYITGLFNLKKSPSGTASKGLFSRISPKSKDISKSCANLDLRDPETVIEEPIRRKSYSEMSINKTVISRENSPPPPVPPLPSNYTGIYMKDESSDGEAEWKKEKSSCDTLDQSGLLDCSTSSVTGRRGSKGIKKVARQAQLKRHRMAQEIQRKLEETEVKTRELEKRGVSVEKSLRGEDGESSSREESDLLQEWFDLMRDRTELRRYERELIVRAQELELEDRHARLQQELRERLDTDDKKTQEDVELERSIINDMMEIVNKRDSLITVLEEDRLRYSNEDRDLEEQMLAKGLRLTPIRKTQEK